MLGTGEHHKTTPSQHLIHFEHLYIVQQICEAFRPNCAFGDRSMKLGMHAIRSTFGYRTLLICHMTGAALTFKMVTKKVNVEDLLSV